MKTVSSPIVSVLAYYSSQYIASYSRLKLFNLKVKGFQIAEKNGKPMPSFEGGYHASGHASGEELLRMVEEIQPEVVVPVHTERPEFFVERLDGVRVEVVGDGGKVCI